MSAKLAIRLGNNIKQLRKTKQLTLEKLAYEIGISKGYLSDIESGKKIASVEMLEKFAKHLQIDIEVIFKK